MTPTRPLPLSPSRNPSRNPNRNPDRNPNRRLESRQSFRLTKLLTRNNDIDRRIKSGKEYALTAGSRAASRSG